MSGPIIRSGPSPQFSKNWDGIFGKSSGEAQKSVKAAADSKPAKKKPAKTPKEKKADKRSKKETKGSLT